MPVVGISDLAESLIRRYQKLKSDRQNWDSHWDDMAEFVNPRQDMVLEDGITTRGEKKRQRIFDSSGEHANELLASALHSSLTNPATTFFSLRTGDDALDELDPVRQFLQLTTRRMHDVLGNTNFHTEVTKMYSDLGSFGTGNFLMEEDDQHVIRFLERPIYEAFIDENDRGIIDTHFRAFRWTARQILQKFGSQKGFELDEELRRELEKEAVKGHMRRHKVIHAVVPINEIMDEDVRRRLSRRGFKWSSIYIHNKFKKELRISGYREFPYAVPRWTQVSGEVYGRSPGMKALPDIKMLNKMMEVTIRSAQKVVDPPLQLPSDGFILPLMTTPGSLNYYLPGTPDRVEPIVTGSRVDFGLQFIERVKGDISRAFFIDQLQLAQQGPQMTATEVQQRTEEKARLLGPILARQQWEFLRPLIDRLFGIMLRRDMLPEIPEELSETELEVRYSSLIAKAQRTADSNNLLRALSTVQPVIASNPEVMDNIDGDAALRHAFTAFQVPVEVLKTQDQVQELRGARKQALQEQAEIEEAQAQAEIANKVAPLAQG